METPDEDVLNTRRTARVNRDADGDPIGICMFITAAELRSVGVNPDRVDRVAFGLDDDGTPHFEAHE